MQELTLFRVLATSCHSRHDDASRDDKVARQVNERAALRRQHSDSLSVSIGEGAIIVAHLAREQANFVSA